MGRSLRQHSARRAAFIAGARAAVPSLPAMAVWGMVTGVVMMKLGLALAPALGMTFIVYSGTAQLTVLPLMASSTPVWTLVLAAALAGLRFVVYSAVLSQAQAHGPLVQRVALLNGANVLTALVWLASSVLGIGLASWLPPGGRIELSGGAGAAGLHRADAGGPRGLGRRRGQHRGGTARGVLGTQAGHLCHDAQRRGRCPVGGPPGPLEGTHTVHRNNLELWVLIALLALVSRSFFVLLPRRWQPRGRVQISLHRARSITASRPQLVPRHHGVVQPDVRQPPMAFYARVPKRRILVAPEREHRLVHLFGVKHL